MTEISPKLMPDTKPQNQEAERKTSKTRTKKKKQKPQKQKTIHKHKYYIQTAENKRKKIGMKPGRKHTLPIEEQR